MNDLPRQKLKEIVLHYGRSVCDDQRRCEGLLKDHCGEHRKEIFALVSALKERVPADLLTGGACQPYELLQAKLVRRLHDDLGLADGVARWAVDSWAIALGVLAAGAAPPAPAAAPAAAPGPATFAPRTPDAERYAMPSQIFSAPAVDPDDPFALVPTHSAEDQLRQALRSALAGGVLTEYEKAKLKDLREKLGIHADAARRLVAEVRAELGIGSRTATGTAPPTQVFAFETVTLDDRGKLRERRAGQACSFIEDLGENVSLEMVEVPGGSFLMGSPPDEPERGENEGPQRQVAVAPFFISKYPVTQMQWRSVYARPQVQRHLLPAPARFKKSNRPVESITWFDAVEFCQRLVRLTGRSYRLPSEAEWEYACRAGTTTPFSFGPTISTEFENYNGVKPYGAGPRGKNRAETTTAGSFMVANAFGIADMHGNIWEWCADPWHETYAGAPPDSRIWEDGGDMTRRVTRGGSWGSVAKGCRSANRMGLKPEAVSEFQGLRLVIG